MVNDNKMNCYNIVCINKDEKYTNLVKEKLNNICSEVVSLTKEIFICTISMSEEELFYELHYLLQDDRSKLIITEINEKSVIFC